jgi:uncharacterized membrane protein YedE/YeeE
VRSRAAGDKAGVLFGIGWGLGGLCPAPGLVAAGAGSTTGLAFVAAMLVGMLIQHSSTARRSP